MKDSLELVLNEALKELNVFVYDIKYIKNNGMNLLEIILDSDDIIDLNKVVDATKIINPIIDEKDLIKEEYVLDVYAKEKGVNE